ncbi:hypothetical protein [Mycoplasmopsis cynos]|uniref:hypothetical protein n=1 Tax=Mycoplasmopsis cynos TaxID=171284 RepID=UPI002AFF1178|nr:hypothetical protein [Mycoplasmopsis cynos]WQQ17760.1 hypothetical protein RRG56_00390 [Mycoplasmopsis cynos]
MKIIFLKYIQVRHHIDLKKLLKQQTAKNIKKAILSSIISIDRSNSTHLEAINGIRLKIFKRIISLALTIEDLKKKLEDTNLNKDHLLFKIADAIMDENNGKRRFSLSFASKFCAYASKRILGEVKYPKYDNIFSNNLFLLLQKYIDENTSKNKNTYKINHEVKELNEYIKKYLLYINDIKK